MQAYEVGAEGSLYPYSLLVALMEALNSGAPLIEDGGSCELPPGAQGKGIKVVFPSGEGSKSKYGLGIGFGGTRLVATGATAGIPAVDVMTLCWGAQRSNVLYARCPEAAAYIRLLLDTMRAAPAPAVPALGPVIGWSGRGGPVVMMLGPSGAAILPMLAALWEPRRPGASVYGTSPTRLTRVSAKVLGAPRRWAPSGEALPHHGRGRVAVVLRGRADATCALIRDAVKCGFIGDWGRGEGPIEMRASDYGAFSALAKAHGCEHQPAEETWDYSAAAAPQRWVPIPA